MEVLYKVKQSGKTTEVIKKAAETENCPFFFYIYKKWCVWVRTSQKARGGRRRCGKRISLK